MKILRVSSDLYPAFVGGIALHVHELSVMQSKMGHDVTVYTSIWTNEPLYEDRGDYDVIRFKGFTIFRNSITLKLLSALISNAKNYDVVHAHSQLYCSTLFCVIGKRIKKISINYYKSWFSIPNSSIMDSKDLHDDYWEFCLKIC